MPPRSFGYLASLISGQTNENNPVGAFAVNSFGPLAPAGRYLVKYPLLFEKETHSQVVAQSGTSEYCNFTQPWYPGGGSDAAVDVICFDNAGNPKPSAFLSTFTSRI